MRLFRRKTNRISWGNLLTTNFISKPGFDGREERTEVEHCGLYRHTKWKYLTICLFWTLLILIFLFLSRSRHWNSSSGTQTGDSRVRQRHLLESGPIKDYVLVYDVQCSVKDNISASEAKSHGHGISWETCDYEISTNLPGVWIAFYVFVTIILFIAIAIVCDDFFVPSLEAISEKLHLSEDVAGATFMAAGSSAPELFSSIAGVAFQSDVGVGTIAGSAVFNILVIVALSGAFSKSLLHLDWRPLARDSFFYGVSLSFFVYMVWDTALQVWEPIILLLIYILYIITMIFNPRLMTLLKKLEINSQQNAVVPEDEFGHCNNLPKKSVAGTTTTGLTTTSRESLRSNASREFKHDRRNSIMGSIRRNSLLKPNKTSLDLPLNTSKDAIQTGDSGIHSPADQEHRRCSQNSSNAKLADKEENRENQLASDIPPPENLSPTLDDKKEDPGHDNMAFHVDITKSNGDMNATQRVDSHQSSLTKNDKSNLSISDRRTDPSSSSDEEEEDDHINCCCKCCPPIRGAPPKFESDEDRKKISSNIVFVLKWIVFVLAFPFLVFYSYTIPECSKKTNRKWFLVSFFMSVLWIAAISFAMVTVVSRMGCLIGVDPFVMSIVVLAAGTSIPDLLSSIIVARDGYGDMAVSNAIGSNVFDINLGLGFPFCIRFIIELGKPFDVFSAAERRLYCEGGMAIHPLPKFGFILIGMLVMCLVVLIVTKFRLVKPVGFIFFTIYILFLVYAFIQEFVCTYSC